MTAAFSVDVHVHIHPSPELATGLAAFTKGIEIMGKLFDQLSAQLQALEDSNDRALALLAEIKAALDAALAKGEGLTPEEAQQLADRMAAQDVQNADAIAAASLAPAG